MMGECWSGLDPNQMWNLARFFGVYVNERLRHESKVASSNASRWWLDVFIASSLEFNIIRSFIKLYDLQQDTETLFTGHSQNDPI